jgi:Phage tail tube protein
VAQATGRVYITVDGDLLRSMPGASLQTGGVDRQAKILDSGDAHHIVVPVVSEVVASVVHLPDTDVVAMREWSNVTLKFVTDTGDGYVINNAWVATVGPLTNGEISVTFNGPRANRLS